MLKYFFTLLVGVLTTVVVMAQSAKKATAFFNSGIKLKESGMFLEAIASFKKAIALNKKYDSAYLELGMLYVKVSKADSAVMTLKNAVKINSGFTNAYIAMGNIYRDYIKNADEAIVNYLSALKNDSSNKVTCYSLAWCYNSKEYYREAVKYAIKALEIDNNYKPAYNELGHAYRKLGAYEEAVAQFKKNMAVSVNELPYLYSGYCYVELKQKENALLMFDELNKLNPKMAEALKKRIDALQ